MPTFNSTRNLQGLLNLIQLLTMAMHWCCEYCINSFLKDSISLFLACSVTCPSDDLGRAVIGSGNHHQRPPGTSSTPPHPSCSLPFNPNLQHSLSTAAHRKPTDKSATLPSSKYSELPSSVELWNWISASAATASTHHLRCFTRRSIASVGPRTTPHIASSTDTSSISDTTVSGNFVPATSIHRPNESYLYVFSPKSSI